MYSAAHSNRARVIRCRFFHDFVYLPTHIYFFVMNQVTDILVPHKIIEETEWMILFISWWFIDGYLVVLVGQNRIDL